MTIFYRRCFVPFLIFFLLLIPIAPGQDLGRIELNSRKNVCERIYSVSGIKYDYLDYSLLDLLDFEGRIKTSLRIKSSYGIRFDWKQFSMIELMDFESRISTANKIKIEFKEPVDWKKYSSFELLQIYYSRMPKKTGPPQAENGDFYGVDNDSDGRIETVYVRGYYKKDGTYVRGHYRAAPKKRSR